MSKFNAKSQRIRLLKELVSAQGNEYSSGVYEVDTLPQELLDNNEQHVEHIETLSELNDDKIYYDLSSEIIVISVSQTKLTGFTFINKNDVYVYVKCFDKVNPVLGTDKPKTIIPVPPNGYNLNSSNNVYRTFSNGLAIAAVTGLDYTSTDAPTLPIYCEVICE